MGAAFFISYNYVSVVLTWYMKTIIIQTTCNEIAQTNTNSRNHSNITSNVWSHDIVSRVSIHSFLDSQAHELDRCSRTVQEHSGLHLAGSAATIGPIDSITLLALTCILTGSMVSMKIAVLWKLWALTKSVVTCLPAGCSTLYRKYKCLPSSLCSMLRYTH